jgi:hypothetical protein
VQQHFSTTFFASLQNSFRFFCCSQQHVFTSLPVSVQVIFGEAADAIVATVNAASSGSHFIIHVLLVSSSLHLGVMSKVKRFLQSFASPFWKLHAHNDQQDD